MKTSHQGIWLTIKRTAIVTAVLGALLVLAPGARAGDNVTFGIEAGYNTRYETPVAGLAFTYRLKPHFRLGADADIAFRHKDYDALLLDVDAHFPFASNAHVEFYPLVGANFSAWSHHIVNENDDDVTTRTSAFGLNFGGGMGIKVTSTLKLNIQARYTLVSQRSGARITAGIAYVF